MPRNVKPLKVKLCTVVTKRTKSSIPKKCFRVIFCLSDFSFLKLSSLRILYSIRTLANFFFPPGVLYHLSIPYRGQMYRRLRDRTPKFRESADFGRTDLITEPFGLGSFRDGFSNAMGASEHAALSGPLELCGRTKRAVFFFFF